MTLLALLILAVFAPRPRAGVRLTRLEAARLDEGAIDARGEWRA